MKRASVFASTIAITGFLTGMAAAQNADIMIDKQEFNAALQAKLPQDILDDGKMISVNHGSFPPYDIITDSQTLTGASADMAQAISELLGIEIEHASVQGLSAVLSGIASGRFQFAMGPVGDFKSREETVDFVVWVQEFVVFAVQAGNPTGIDDLADVCGNRIAVMAGGSAERVITEQSEICTAAGEEPVDVKAFADQPTSVLSVRADRADAFFSSQAPLTFFVSQAEGQLELAAVGKENGFPGLVQGAVLEKGSPLGPIILESIEILIENGTYGKIMTKWGLENNMVDVPGINMAVR